MNKEQKRKVKAGGIRGVILRRIRTFAEEVATGATMVQHTPEQQERELEAARKLLQIIFADVPTDEEIKATLPW